MHVCLEGRDRNGDRIRFSRVDTLSVRHAEELVIRRTIDYAIQCQECAAIDHESYEEHRDCGEIESARLTAEWAAGWFRDGWFARFGEHEPEAWS